MDKGPDFDWIGIVAVLHAALHSKPERLAAAIDAHAALRAAGAQPPAVLA